MKAKLIPLRLNELLGAAFKNRVDHTKGFPACRQVAEANRGQYGQHPLRYYTLPVRRVCLSLLETATFRSKILTEHHQDSPESGKTRCHHRQHPDGSHATESTGRPVYAPLPRR